MRSKKHQIQKMQQEYDNLIEYSEDLKTLGEKSKFAQCKKAIKNVRTKLLDLKNS